MVNIFKYSFSAILFLAASCISTKKLFNDAHDQRTGFEIKNFNNLYSNISTNGSEYDKLWKILYECKTLKYDTTPNLDNTSINLEFTDYKTLKVTAISENRILNSIYLKGSVNNNYFEVKPKLRFIPIPILFFQIKERRVIIGINDKGNLLVTSGTNEFLMILFMSGGFDGIETREYEKINAGLNPEP